VEGIELEEEKDREFGTEMEMAFGVSAAGIDTVRILSRFLQGGVKVRGGNQAVTRFVSQIKFGWSACAFHGKHLGYNLRMHYLSLHLRSITALVRSINS
jgi:hypothetical protein